MATKKRRPTGAKRPAVVKRQAEARAAKLRMAETRRLKSEFVRKTADIPVETARSSAEKSKPRVLPLSQRRLIKKLPGARNTRNDYQHLLWTRRWDGAPQPL